MKNYTLKYDLFICFKVVPKTASLIKLKLNKIVKGWGRMAWD